MLPLIATGVGVIATITIGAMLGFMIDGAELTMTSKEIMTIQNTKGDENLQIQIKNNDLIITNEGNLPSSVVAIKVVDEIMGENVRKYETTLNPSSSTVVSGNYSNKNVQVITNLGNVFSNKINPPSNLPLGSAGTHMKIIQIPVQGSIISGKEEHLGIESTMRPYSLAHETDNYAFVLNNTNMKIIHVPTFDGSYHYAGQLVKNQNNPNILGYTFINRIGNAYVDVNYDYLVFRGAGQTRAMLDHQLTNKVIKLSGTMPKDSMVEIRGVTNELLSQEKTILRISANPENIVVQSNHVDNLDAVFDNDTETYAMLKPNWNQAIFDFKTLSQRTIESINIGLDLDRTYWATLCVYVDTNGGSFRELTRFTLYYLKTSGEISINHAGLFRYLKITNCETYQHPIHVKIYEIVTGFVPNNPNIDTSVFGNDMYYETVFTMPYFAKLVVISNSNSAITVRGDIPKSEPSRFEITGLLPNTPYRIERSGLTSVVSVTASDGSISLSPIEAGFGTSDSTWGILRLYADSVGHIGEFDTLVIDVINNGTILLPPSNDGKLIYVPHAYVHWILPTVSTISDVFVDEIPIPYLNNDYEAGSAVRIPIIPNAKKIHSVIDGVNMTIQISHIETPTKIFLVQKNTALFSKYRADNSVASATAEASSSAFMTATHTGKMYAVIDMNGMGGSASFTMNSNYTGDLAEGRGSYTRTFPVRSTISVNYKYYSPPPESITNINNLAANHANQLIAALNRGQISTLIADVDVYKNFKHVKTERFYIANSGTANIISQINNATYDTLSFSPSYYYNNNGYDKFNSNHQVRIEYPRISAGHITDIDVAVGDMVEFVIRVGLAAHGTPVPEINQYNSGVHATSATSAYVRTMVEHSDGSIIVGIS